MTHLLSGTALSQVVRNDLQRTIKTHVTAGHRSPGLATVLVGCDPASQVYVRNKIRACETTGIQSYHYDLSAAVSEKDLVELIDTLNRREEVDGILVQLPLPKHLSAERLLDLIEPKKDVDGFHPLNIGNLMLGRPGVRPC